MLSIVPIKSVQNARDYFEHDNYYAKGTKEALDATLWHGNGCQEFNVSGAVDIDLFEQSLRGQMPDGSKLGRTSNGEVKHRPGYDLTFSAPKSISILAEIGGDTRLYKAHTEAVQEALDYIQSKAISARISKKGQIYFEQTNNVTVSLFRHGTSRTVDDKSLPDPDTHTHAVLHNYTRCKDGKLRSISSESLFNHKMTAGMVYRAALAIKVQEIGYEVEKTRDDGLFEVKGLDREDIEYFSKRHMQIKGKMGEIGISSYKASKIVSRETRESKKDYQRDELVNFWESECEKLNISPKDMVKDSLSHQVELSKNKEEVALEAMRHSVAHHEQRNAVLLERDLVKTALAKAVGQIILSDAESALDTLKREGTLIQCVGNRWVTKDALALEKDNIARMQRMQGKTQPILSIEAASYFVDTLTFGAGDKRYHLTDDQKGAVSLVLSSTDQIVCLNGKPGVGKTFMLKAIEQEATEHGFELIGLAAQAKAAKKITEESGIKSMTVSRFLSNHESAQRLGVSFENKKRLIVIDEASMLSSNQMNRFLKVIESLGDNTHVVLQGDEAQLPAVDAGAPFAQFLKQDAAQYHLNEIRRQKNASLKFAVESTLAGNIEAAINNIGYSNIESIEDKGERLQAIAAQYLNLDKETRKKTIVLMPANEDRIATNHLIREGLKNEGTLKGPEITSGVLVSKGLTRAAIEDLYQYEEGNIIRFNQRIKSNGIHPGEYLEVKEVDHDKQVLSLQSSTGRKVSLNNHELKALGKDNPLEVYFKEERGLMAGDIIQWRRITDQENDMVTSETAKVLKVSENDVTLKLPNKKHYALNINDFKHQHWDYAFSSTVHSAQGQTAKYVMAHMDSTRAELATQSLFYVAISRAEYGAFLYVDDINRVKQSIEARSGVNSTALEAVSETKWDILPVTPEKAYQGKAIESSLSNLEVKTKTLPQYDFNQIANLLENNAETLVREILGEPNQKLSNSANLRYGQKGSLSVSLKSGKAGLWTNFESGDTGNLYQLIRNELNFSDKETLDYIAKRFHLVPGEVQSPSASPRESRPKASKEITANDIKAIKEARFLYQQGRPIEGTLAEKYLRVHRGINLQQFPGMLRFHEGLKPIGEKEQFPAILVPATKSGKILGMQAIFLDPKTGEKAKVAVDKQTFGRPSLGASAKINQTRSQKAALVFEGPEDALSALAIFPRRDIQATFSASNLKYADLKDGQGVIFCLDNDGPNAPSIKSSQSAVESKLSENRNVYTVIPPNIKEDYNDILNASGEKVLKKLILSAEPVELEKPLIEPALKKDAQVKSNPAKQKSQANFEIEI